MRMRKKPNLVPRMERCARFLIQAPEEQRGHWRELKPDAEQIWLELGCGIRDSVRRNAAKPCDTCVCGISPSR